MYPSGTVDSSIVTLYVTPALLILISLNVNVPSLFTKYSLVPSIKLPLLSATDLFVSVFNILTLNPAPDNFSVVPFLYFTKLKLKFPFFTGFSTSNKIVLVFLSRLNINFIVSPLTIFL